MKIAGQMLISCVQKPKPPVIVQNMFAFYCRSRKSIALKGSRMHEE